MWPFRKKLKYPPAIDPEMVGEYPALAKSGGGFFYDDVLEYRVWIHPEVGGEDQCRGDDYYYAFATFEEAFEFSRDTPGAEKPLALVRQLEHINEPEPGEYVHVKGERIAEWRTEWIATSKRNPDSIVKFLEEHVDRPGT